MDELTMRQAVKDLGVRLLDENLVQGTWGNISVRIDDHTMLVTPSGLDYVALKPQDMVVLDMNILERPEGALKPTSEKGIHAGIMLARPEINCVIHSHPVNCSVYACAHATLLLKDEAHKKIFNADKIVTADYGLPGTNTLTKATTEAIGKANAVFMANHGVTCCGKTIEEALDVLRLLEQLTVL